MWHVVAFVGICRWRSCYCVETYALPCVLTSKSLFLCCHFRWRQSCELWKMAIVRLRLYTVLNHDIHTVLARVTISEVNEMKRNQLFSTDVWLSQSINLDFYSGIAHVIKTTANESRIHPQPLIYFATYRPTDVLKCHRVKCFYGLHSLIIHIHISCYW